MEENRQPRRNRKTIVAIVAVASIAVVLFLCIFSLYHLPERDPVETPEVAVDPNYVESPAGDFEETNDVLSGSREQVSEMLGNLEMQYENAKLNAEPYAAQQSGLRLALAYWKAGETPKAKDLINSLAQSYSFDENFVGKCNELLKEINSSGDSQKP